MRGSGSHFVEDKLYQLEEQLYTLSRRLDRLERRSRSRSPRYRRHKQSPFRDQPYERKTKEARHSTTELFFRPRNGTSTPYMVKEDVVGLLLQKGLASQVDIRVLPVHVSSPPFVLRFETEQARDYIYSKRDELEPSLNVDVEPYRIRNNKR